MVNTDTRKDMLTHVVRFTRTLHSAGLPVSLSNLIDLGECFRHIDVGQRDEFYAAARATLISSEEHLAGFDQLFRLYWEHADMQVDVDRGDETEDGNDNLSLDGSETAESPDRNGDGSRSSQGEQTETSYSPDEVLLQKDLGTLSDREIEDARRFVNDLVKSMANRRSRRYRTYSRGNNLDFRRMLRRNALRIPDDFSLSFKQRRIRKTRLMVLCDVSGSMERYSRFLIQFIYAMRSELPDVDVAVFSTRMSVITEQLTTRNIGQSLMDVSRQVHDWSGGTNIGACLAEFNRHFDRHMSRSHCLVLILSDGWDRGDPELLRYEIQCLQRRAEKLVWLNPLLGNTEYQPLCKGIATARPFIDYFLPAHNIQSLAEVARLMRILRV